MENYIFPSIGFTLCGLIFLTLIIVMYGVKKKFKGPKNSIYKFMLGLTMVLLLLEIFFVVLVFKFM